MHLQTSLNAFMALGRPAWKEARVTLQKLLSGKKPCEIMSDDSVGFLHTFDSRTGSSSAGSMSLQKESFLYIQSLGCCFECAVESDVACS